MKNREKQDKQTIVDGETMELNLSADEVNEERAKMPYRGPRDLTHHDPSKVVISVGITIVIILAVVATTLLVLTNHLSGEAYQQLMTGLFGVLGGLYIGQKKSP